MDKRLYGCSLVWIITYKSKPALQNLHEKGTFVYQYICLSPFFPSMRKEGYRNGEGIKILAFKSYQISSYFLVK